jgi:hypothetical protein
MLRHSLLQKLRYRVSQWPPAQRAYNAFRLLVTPTFLEDGLATIHNCDFLKDPQFAEAYDAALAQQPDVRIRWRAHVTQWAGFHASRLDGDFIECGVNRGFLSASVMKFVGFESLTDRRFFLFDTYCGLVEEQVTDRDTAAYRNVYEDCHRFVVESFRKYRNVVVVKGVVPESLSTVPIDKVAYLSIDMNCAFPEIAALEHFWPKLVSGGVVVLDDYGFSGHEEQKEGADRFAAARNVRILSLPTGQGLLIKP